MSSTFDYQLSRLAKDLDIELEVVVRKTALLAYNSVTKKTPVDTGRARANWNVGVGSADESMETKGFGKPTGKNVNSRVPPSSPKARPARLKKGDGKQSIWITNSLPYMTVLENGSSQQAPKGMVAITLNELRSNIQNVLRK